MSHSVGRVVTALLLLPAGPAAAETLYNQDGVLMSATAVAIHPGAATCRVREERHTAEQYERLKPNEGQPLNVWRVELVVANYSGRALDYLNAHLNVTSAWPPCDHWDGPEGSYGAPVVWTGPLMSIQDVGIVEPGEEVRETAFVLAWHEEEPALGRWDINYDFAASPPAGGAAAETRAESTGTGRATAAAEAPFAGGSGLPAGIRPEDTCAGKTVGSLCWQEIANQPGCYLWNPDLDGGQSALSARMSSDAVGVTWTGGCSGGRASGIGERSRERMSTASGELRNGKATGHWTVRSNGAVEEGTFVDGRRNGHWTLRFDSGGVREGPYVNGKRNGHWTHRGSWGVDEGPYVDGMRNGYWTERRASGNVREGTYVDDYHHGRWTWRRADGDVTYDCYSNGDEVDCP